MARNYFCLDTFIYSLVQIYLFYTSQVLIVFKYFHNILVIFAFSVYHFIFYALNIYLKICWEKQNYAGYSTHGKYLLIILIFYRVYKKLQSNS